MSVASWPEWPLVHDRGELEALIGRVLDGRTWTVRSPGDGPSLTEGLEDRWARRCGAAHALATASGTAALELALRGLGVGPGDEVVVPALGWYATAAAVLRTGARPVFADVDEATSCVAPAAVERCIGARTRAVLAVHLHCAAADLDGLARLAAEHGIALVEDCAQVHGMAWRDAPVGSHGVVGCFSFNQEKLIPAGEGGAVVTSDPELYERMHALRTDGYRRAGGGARAYEPHGEVLGGNSCPSELQAAMALHQLDWFDRLQARRTANAIALERALVDTGCARPLHPGEGCTVRSWYEFGVVLERDEFGGAAVDRIAAHLADELGAPVHPTDVPAPRSPLLPPGTRERAPAAAESLHASLVVFHHRLLLSPRIVEALPAALVAVRRALGASARAG